jgi:hypothetical protein
MIESGSSSKEEEEEEEEEVAKCEDQGVSGFGKLSAGLNSEGET